MCELKFTWVLIFKSLFLLSIYFFLSAQEQELYQREGLGVNEVHYVDNQDCIGKSLNDLLPKTWIKLIIKKQCVVHPEHKQWPIRNSNVENTVHIRSCVIFSYISSCELMLKASMPETNNVDKLQLYSRIWHTLVKSLISLSQTKLQKSLFNSCSKQCSC